MVFPTGLRAGLATLSACLLALTACTDDGPPAPSATPVQLSPAETQQERTVRLDKEAAENAYRAVSAESDRLAMAGGADKPTKVIIDNATGKYLDAVMRLGLSTLKKNGWRTDRPAVTSVTANGGWSPTEIGLTACEDASSVRLLDRSGKEVNKDRPRRFVQTLTARKVEGRWKIAEVESRIVKTFAHESGCSQS